MSKKYKNYEKQVREKFILWLQEKYPNWSISQKPIRISLYEKRRPFNQKQYLSPDIDVLAYCRSTNKLVSFEVKGPVYSFKKCYELYDKETGKKVGHMAYADRSDLKALSVEHKIKRPYRPHKVSLNILYKGIGESLFNCRYVDQSYLVLPNFFYLFHRFHETFFDILLSTILLLGLIRYEFSFNSNQNLEIKEFVEIRKAKDLSLWQNYERAVKDKEKIDSRIQKIRANLIESIDKTQD